jgi:putative ABC transport system substrate-binding protein
VKRRGFLALAALLASGAAGAQPSRLPRVGYLLLIPLSEPPSRERRALLEGLRELGYVPGRSIELVYRSAQNEADFLEDLCEELLAQKVDLIIVAGAITALAAKRCTATVPIVFPALGDPVGIGVVASLSRPGGNLTGVSFISSELAGKRLELLREVMPGAKRIALLWDTRNANAAAESRATVLAATGLGLMVVPLPVSADAELESALGRLRAARPDALYVAFEGGLVAGYRSYIAQATLESRIALVSGWSSMTDAGGLLSYAPDIAAMFRRAARYVDRILKGANPAELPIEQPTQFELVVNLRTAKALRIPIPQAVLLRADRVVE